MIFGRDQVVDEPTPEKVARLFGLSYDLPEEDAFEVVIVGGGPAGVAAAVYAGAEGLKALVVEDVAIGARPACRAGSRTTWAFRQEFPARTWSGAARCRP